MINSYHRVKQHKGAATLIITVILLVAAVLIMVFATNYSIMQQKTATNQYSDNQAFEAGEAGLEFAIPYLNQNSSTILANPVNGFIPVYSDTNTNNVVLANSSKYTIVYSNPVASNYQLIQITSTGTSADATSTRIVQQLVQKQALLSNPPTNPTSSLGPVTLSGNSNVNNPNSSYSVQSGSTVSLSGSSTTAATAGSSSSGSIGPDIKQNVSSYQGMTSDAFFQSYFGTDSDTIKNSVDLFYPSGSSPSLDGVNGKSIWIDQPFSITGNDVIGASSPVLLIVNGNFNITGKVTINGFIYVIGDFNFNNSGTPIIAGGIATSGQITVGGNAKVTFDNLTINTIKTQTGKNYAKVTGSWRDF